MIRCPRHKKLYLNRLFFIKDFGPDKHYWCKAVKIFVFCPIHRQYGPYRNMTRLVIPKKMFIEKGLIGQLGVGGNLTFNMCLGNIDD